MLVTDPADGALVDDWNLAVGRREAGAPVAVAHRCQLGRSTLSPLGGVALVALGGLELAPCLLEPLGRPAALLRIVEPPCGQALETIPRARTLLFPPEPAELIEEELATGLHVDGQHVEPTVGGPVACASRKDGVERRRISRSRADGARILGTQVGDLLIDHR
jgi:hypothetical protein